MPVCLNLWREHCLVVGGGNVALRKVRTLKKFGASITCLSPAFVKPLESLASEKKIRCVRKFYPRTKCLKKYALVVAATDDPAVNKQVAKDAARDKALVNVADKSSAGTIILPAILKRKGFVIGVSTGGRSPAQAKKMRDRISHAL